MFDWDRENKLAAGVTIDTNTFIVTAIKPSTAALPTVDEETVLSDGRRTWLRIDGTTAALGARYKVANRVLTNEDPAQTFELSFEIIIQQPMR